MTSKKRFLALAVLITTFLIVAPLTLLYALGYRYDLQKHEFVKTGTFVVKSQPKGAEIFLSGRDTGQKTPAALHLLAPGDYQVELMKENYRTWSKPLTILPERVTYAHPYDQKIALFLKQPEITSLTPDAQGLLHSNGRIVGWTSSPLLTLRDEITKTDYKTKIPYSAADSALSLSEDGNWIFVSQKSRLMAAYNFDTLHQVDFLPSFNISSVHALDNDTLLFETTENKLFQYDVPTGNLFLRKNNIEFFSTFQNQVYYFATNELLVSDKASSTAAVIAKDAPPHATAQIIPALSSQVFLLLDNTLYSATAGMQKIQTGVDGAAWDSASKKLLVYNSNTVWLYDPQIGESPELVIRSETPVTSAQINNETGNIYYLQNGRIKAIETFAQVSRNVEDLIVPEKPVDSFYIDANGEFIYYHISGEGTYKARIR